MRERLRNYMSWFQECTRFEPRNDAVDMEVLESVSEFASKIGNIDILVNNSGGPPGGHF